MSKKMKRIFIAFCTIALVFSTATTAFATDDPLQVVNNLSEFIRAADNSVVERTIRTL